MARWVLWTVMFGFAWLTAPALAQTPGNCPAGYVEMTVQGVVPTEQGMVFIQQGKRMISVDSRPSDAIALAIGNRLPIYVSKKVVERAGIRKNTPEPASPPPNPKDTPENLLKDIIDPAGEKTL